MKEFLRNLRGKKESEFQDMGFGTKVVENSRRLLNTDGSFNVKRKGFRSFDIYHTLITMSWTKFNMVVLGSYIAINFLFALIYMLIGLEHLAGVMGETAWERFLDSFFFSAQTLTTVGYGRISPVGAAASTVAAIESLLGLLGFALATGLLYGRFARPRAKILYTTTGVIAPYRGMRAFMVRIANMRASQLIEVEVELVISMLKADRKTRTFETVKLERSKINFLALSWTLVHPIDEDSPLFGITEDEFNRSDAEFIIAVKAFDDVFSQTVYSRSSYKFDEVKWGAKFVSIIEGEEGYTTLSLDRISDTEPAELPEYSKQAEAE